MRERYFSKEKTLSYTYFTSIILHNIYPQLMC